MKKLSFIFGFCLFNCEVISMQPSEILSFIDVGRKTPALEVMERDCVRSQGVLRDEFVRAMAGDEKSFHSLIVSLADNYISYKDGVLFSDDATRYYLMIRIIFSVMSSEKIEKKTEVWDYAFAYLLQALHNIEDTVVSSTEKSKAISAIDLYYEHE